MKKTKSPEIVVDGKVYIRIPLKTHVLSAADDAAQVLLTYAKPQYQPGDTVFISETAVAIMQNRHRDWRTIKPTRLAKWLSRKVIWSPCG